MPEGSRWRPCAAGFDDGRVLLVMGKRGLAIAVKRWVSPGTHITLMSLDELRALLAPHGLAMVDAASEQVRTLETACAKAGLAWLLSTPETLGRTEGLMVLALRNYEAELARRGQRKEEP